MKKSRPKNEWNDGRRNKNDGKINLKFDEFIKYKKSSGICLKNMEYSEIQHEVVFPFSHLHLDNKHTFPPAKHVNV